jgi:hypothetical protein
MVDSARRALAAAEAAAVAGDTAHFVDTTETPLENHGPRSLPFGPGFAIALGSLITGFGLVFVLGVSLVALFAPKGLPRDHRWLIPPALVFMILIGAGLIRSGLADQSRTARGKELAARHPDQPWYADWPWDPQGAFAESALGAIGVFAMLFIILVMAPFNVLWLYALDPHQDDKTRVLALMVLIPDFFIYLLIRGVTSLVKDRVRFGRPRLQFELFPFFLGETLEARVTAKMFAGQERVVATLRCIEERTMVGRYRGRRSVSVRPYQLYLARQAFPGTFAGEDVPLRIDSTRSRSSSARRWPPASSCAASTRGCPAASPCPSMPAGR